ncbi:hypothetical protein C8R43DRAFT_1124363 [Mycena crocata]|nr:hypothetical protein C8R43DRAFT_1124363 [Mycena crocata]
MLSRSSLSLLALLSCIGTVVGGPVRTSLYRRGQNVLIGYRYVNAQKAAEYNYYGTLTAVGASGTQLGDGAYISPTINEWQVADDYWQCAIFADSTKFRNVAKMYIPENSNTFFSSRRLSSYLGQARLDPTNTILWSKIDGDAQQHIQMVIPPYFLRQSPAFRGAYGNGDLGITINKMITIMVTLTGEGLGVSLALAVTSCANATAVHRAPCRVPPVPLKSHRP